MYITLRGTPSGDKTTAAGKRSRIPPTVLGLGVVSLFTDISSESVSAILPVYITIVVGMGPLAFGFIDGIYQGISALVRLVGGVWADRAGRPKWVAFCGYALSAAARIPLLFAQGFWVLTSTVATDRIGKGLRTGPRDALIATASDPDHLGRNFGVHRSLDTVGALIGPLLAFAVLAAFPFGLGGYHAVFVFSLAAAVIGVAILGLVVPDLRRRAPAADGPPAPRMRWSELNSPGLRRLLVAAAALGLATVGDGFLYLALQDGGQIPTRFIPLLYVGTNLAYLVLAIPLGRVADRWGRARVFLTGHVLLLISYGLAASHLGGRGGVVAVLLLLGTFYAATDGVLAALASRLVPEHARASGISAAQTVVALARFASSLLFGGLWQFTTRATALVVIGALLAAAILLSAWLLLRLRAAATPVTP